MTFDQETHERIQFAENALKVVVGQVTFPVSYRLAAPGAMPRVQDALAGDYPISLPPTPQMTVSFAPGVAPVVSPAESPAQFADVSKTHIVTVGRDTASLETTAYTRWADFRAAFERLLHLVAAEARPPQVNRLGLRFVDEVPVRDARTIDDWARFIDASLLGSEASPARDGRVTRTIQHVAIDMGGDTVNLRHGYTRVGDGAGGPPSVYLIDTDISAVDVPWDIPAILERVDRYHGWAWSLFIRSLTEATVKLMGKGDK